ncbi:hypothetical protein CTRG_04619 [Candida tropicalis MYA-3404]|uniref:Trafficking protein particle complex subunit n=1 Tax=Candida tropicalis (strain ATCC MYA-3404 / T1) TaxID=294747 RepID=C5MEX6_CANTT|nr:hypothetical protein CTRG_04619 [Candida tropicalis MYA-3404]EER31836.1 hypothetical protein CTRG_04619 [Candida tropicalis MYA-3404]KAG4405420.1 hypothetical protein JTP64_005456 [Candida tropicalis]
MKAYSLLILNKAGGLIYQNELSPGLSKLTANDYLVLAGTLHGVHAIGSRLTSSIHTGSSKSNTEEYNSSQNSIVLNTGKAVSPNSNRSGLQRIETDLFNLCIFQSVSGLKFIIITAPNSGSYDNIEELFRQLYIVYSDYVMKDPFYSLDMPIKSSLFDGKVRELFA